MKALLFAGGVIYATAIFCASIAYLVYPTAQAATLGAGIGLAWSLALALYIAARIAAAQRGERKPQARPRAGE